MDKAKQAIELNHLARQLNELSLEADLLWSQALLAPAGKPVIKDLTRASRTLGQVRAGLGLWADRLQAAAA